MSNEKDRREPGWAEDTSLDWHHPLNKPVSLKELIAEHGGCVEVGGLEYCSGGRPVYSDEV